MQRDEEERRHEGEECRVCRGSGIANVPHPHNIHDGEWVYPWYECGVACYCFRGQRVLENNRATRERAKEKAQRHPDILVPREVWTFAFYELRNPDWQRQVAEKQSKQKTEREAMAATRQQDKRLGPLAKLMKLIGGE